MQNELRKIEDEAWAKMSLLLDKEMPQKKKKRRFIIWFFAAATAIPLLAISTWLALPSSKQASVLQPSLNEMDNITINASNVDTKVTETSIASQNEMIVNKATTSLSKPVLSPQSIAASTITKDDAITHSPIPAVMNGLLDDNQTTSYKAISSDSSNFSIDETTISTLPENTEANALRETGDVQAIASINPKIFENEIRKTDIHLLPSHQSLKRPSDHKSFALAISAGTRMMLPARQAMPLLGLNLAYHFNDKWRIGTGLHYSFATQNSDSLVVAANYYGEYAAQLDKSFLQGSNSTEFSYINEIILFDHKIIHVPLAIGYAFNKHLSLSGGIYYDKMVSQRTNYVLTEVDPAGTTAIKGGKNIFTNRIYSHNLNWMTSIGYNISNQFNLSFDLMGNNKFISGIKSNRNAAPILQLKVNYNLSTLF